MKPPCTDDKAADAGPPSGGTAGAKAKDYSVELLLASVFLNLVLVACIFWFGVCARRALLEASAEAAEEAAQIQTEALRELETGDARRIEALKQDLRLGIEMQRRIAYRLRTGDYNKSE